MNLYVKHAGAFLLSPADGSCFIWDILEPNATAVVKLTGPQDDRVTAVCNHGNNVWTSCRDGCVRMYALL